MTTVAIAAAVGAVIGVIFTDLTKSTLAAIKGRWSTWREPNAKMSRLQRRQYRRSKRD